MSTAETLLDWLDRAIDEAQAELGAELSEFERLFREPRSMEDTDGRTQVFQRNQDLNLRRRIARDVPFGMALEGLTAADLSYHAQQS